MSDSGREVRIEVNTEKTKYTLVSQLEYRTKS